MSLNLNVPGIGKKTSGKGPKGKKQKLAQWLRDNPHEQIKFKAKQRARLDDSSPPR